MGFQGGTEDPSLLSNLLQKNPLSVFPVSRGITAIDGARSWRDFEEELYENAGRFKGLLDSSVAN